jgi:hypothetical protein
MSIAQTPVTANPLAVTLTPVGTVPPPLAVRPPLAEDDLYLPDSDIIAMGVVLERDDTEDETPYVGVLNSGGLSADFTSPAKVRAYAQQVMRFAEQVDAMADRLAAEQGRATAPRPVTAKPGFYAPPLAGDGLPEVGPDKATTVTLDLLGVQGEAEVFISDDAEATAVIAFCISSPVDATEWTLADAERVLAGLPVFEAQLRGLVGKLASYQAGGR